MEAWTIDSLMAECAHLSDDALLLSIAAAMERFSLLVSLLGSAETAAVYGRALDELWTWPREIGVRSDEVMESAEAGADDSAKPAYYVMNVIGLAWEALRAHEHGNAKAVVADAIGGALSVATDIDYILGTRSVTEGRELKLHREFWRVCPDRIDGAAVRELRTLARRQASGHADAIRLFAADARWR